MLYANLLLNVLYHIEIEMKIRESCLQTGNFIYKPGISLTKQDFHLQRGSLGLQRGFSGYYLPAEQIRELNDAESCYQSGDTFFEDEHNAWERLNTELLAQGYSVEEVESLRKKYESKYAQDCKAERAVSKELSLGRSIWKELTVSASAEEKQYDKETIRDRKEQPIR